MWLCGFCGKCSDPRQPMKRRIVYRQKRYLLTVGKEIASETPTCDKCIERHKNRNSTTPIKRIRNLLEVDGKLGILGKQSSVIARRN